MIRTLDLPRRDLSIGEAATDVVGMRQFMRILNSTATDLEAAQFLMQVIVTFTFDEGDVVVVGVVAVPETDTRHELVRFGNFIEGFEISPTSGWVR